MKSRIAAILTVVLCLLLSQPVVAVDVEEEQAAALGLEEIPEALTEEAEEFMDGVSVADSTEAADEVLERLRESALKGLRTYLGESMQSAVSMLAVTLLCAVGLAADSGGRVGQCILLAGVAGIAAVAAGDMNSILHKGLDTLHQLLDFSRVLLPSLTAAAASSGAISSAAAKYAVTALYMDILMGLSSAVVMPAVCGYTALIIANAAADGQVLTGAVKCVKWLCVTLLTILTLAFTVYLSVTGIVIGSADAMTTRLAKTAVSSALPVVGSILSDAAGTLAAGFSTLRGAIGVFGMLAILAICLTPFLQLGVQYLLYKATAALAACVSDSRLAALIDGLGTAFGMILAVIGCGAAFLFISFYSLIRMVT
ncbi:MAG: stage III sporulation protein AE [Eubacteriales bacterium]|nr:stage III sporulation protein AE [Eubacteriales bacterium]